MNGRVVWSFMQLAAGSAVLVSSSPVGSFTFLGTRRRSGAGEFVLATLAFAVGQPLPASMGSPLMGVGLVLQISGMAIQKQSQGSDK